MEERLFEKVSFYAVWQHQLNAAAEEVNRLNRKAFSDPSLGGVLHGIVKKYEIDIARFEGEISAKRRTEERRRQDMWGDTHNVKVTSLDVSIPFVGEAETFRIAPSTMTVLYDRVSIGRNTLTINVPDDDGAEAKVQEFKKHVEHNLQTLRTEYERSRPQLEQAVQQAANQRKAQVDAEDARDNGRSFRVTN